MKFQIPINYDELRKSTEYNKLTASERTELNSYLPTYLGMVTEQSKSGLYCCPLCGSGHGKNGTGALGLYTSKNGLNWKCQACGAGGDIFELVGRLEHLDTFPAQVERVRQLYGKSTDTQTRKSSPVSSSLQANAEPRQEKEETRLPDYTENYKEWTQHLQETDYHRGISLYTLARFNVGYCKEWRHPKANSSTAPSERLIIPISEHSYTARDITGTASSKYMKVSSPSDRHLFNERAIQTAESPVFIVEGELDALSIIDCGGEAVALGSTSGANFLISLLEAVDGILPEALVLALDSDEAGQKAQQTLIEACNRLKIDYSVFSYPEGYKDFNEILEKDRGLLSEIVRTTRENDQQQKEEAQREYIDDSSLSGFMQKYREEFNSTEIGRCYPTGLSILDNILKGGLRTGLTVIGALSGLGKSSLLMQIARNIAEHGSDCLYFSLEMNKEELLTRTVSYYTYELYETGKTTLQPKTQLDIYLGKGKWNNYESAMLNKCIERIEKYSSRLYIFDGIGEISLEKIRETVRTHIRKTGRNPLVFVDYLQIVAPDKEHNSDKMNTDNVVVGLKKISSSFDIPVIALSSFNRQSYSSCVDMTCFKETGAIEYTADLALAIQPSAAVTSANYDYQVEKDKDEIEIDIVFLKWRQGSTALNVRGSFRKAYFTFREKCAVKYDYAAIRKLEKERVREKEKRRKQEEKEKNGTNGSEQ